MKKDFLKIFQVAVVFIGTIVGAGLASGKEITEFFTSFGIQSFVGIILCGLFYIFMVTMLSKISLKHKLNSYSELINIISPNLLGKLTGVITTLYLISSASIILAGSGAILNEFFAIPKIVGSLIMLSIAAIFILKGTNGLIEVNSIIVPLLISTITVLTVLYFVYNNGSLSIEMLTKFPPKKEGILVSTILYAGYNILCSSGVIIPLSTEINDKKIMTKGIFFGALGLTLLCLMINFMLTLNIPYIYEYEIPLLYVSTPFGSIIQAVLLMVILLEMFSTEVSDVYSISKTLDKSFKISFKKGVFIVLAVALPISQIGFTNLITTLYPLFGLLSLVFITQCIIFTLK